MTARAAATRELDRLGLLDLADRVQGGEPASGLLVAAPVGPARSIIRVLDAAERGLLAGVAVGR